MNAYVIIKKGIPKTIKEKCYDVMLRGGKQNVKLHINWDSNTLKMKSVYCTDSLLETEAWIPWLVKGAPSRSWPNAGLQLSFEAKWAVNTLEYE